MNAKHQPVCSEFAERLVDYSDGELALSQRQSVEEHFTICPACRSLVQRLDASARRLQDEAAAVRTMELSNLRLTAMNRRAISRATLGGIAAMAAICLFSVGIWWWNYRASSPLTAHSLPHVISEQSSAEPMTSDQALLQIVMFEQQARLQATLDFTPDDPWFAEQRLANERLLTKYKQASSALYHETPVQVPAQGEAL